MTAFDREHALAFLNAVYGRQPGVIALTAIKSDGFTKNSFFRSDENGIAEAVAWAERYDKANPPGIYFRTTTMAKAPNKGRGIAPDTLAMPIAWADLDYGQEGHKRKPDQLPNPPTEDAARALVAEAGLPEPTIWVHSGGGLYPLWMLSSDLTYEEKEAVSGGIQDALEVASAAHGWHYGTGVRDLARILRLPGSVNRKTDNPRPCRVIGGTARKVDPALFPKPITPAEKAAKGITGPTAYTPPPRKEYDPSQPRTGVFDTLADVASWADILEPADWTFVGTDSGGELWMRPGGSDSAYSARCFEHNLVCHSESAGLPSGAGQRLTKGRVYSWLWHGGDVSAAARELIQGHGHLPANVNAAFNDAMIRNQWFGLDVTHIGTAPQTVPAADRDPSGYPDAATDEELQMFLDTYTRYTQPARLGRRTGWMKNDPSSRLAVHARHLVEDVFAGYYPADKALAALTDACQHHGGKNPSAPHKILSVALGAALNARSAA